VDERAALVAHARETVAVPMGSTAIRRSPGAV